MVRASQIDMADEFGAEGGDADFRAFEVELEERWSIPTSVAFACASSLLLWTGILSLAVWVL